MKKWLYKVAEIKSGFIGLKPRDIENELARLGQQGWELVFVRPHGMTLLCFMKKEQ